MTENQTSMRANFRRPLLNLEALALVALGFVLYPALQRFSHSYFRHEARAGKIAVSDTRLQHQVPPVCEDAWLFLRRSEISHELVQELEVQRLGRCGDVRPPSRKHAGYDPGFVLPDQSPAYGGNAYQTRHQLFVTTPQEMLRGRIPETNIGQQLKAVHLD